MKEYLYLVSCLALSLVGAYAQTGNTPPGQSGGNVTVPSDTPYSVIDRGPDHRLWQRQTYVQSPNGQVITQVHRYQELASGMCYQQNGRWMDSQDLIQPYSTGSIAQNGPYQVIFANNLNSIGCIDQQTPDNKRLDSSILGLAYYDAASGNSVLFAQVQDTQGELVSPNQVLFQNAFSGVNADVKYIYKKGSFEQNVILREQPPSPESLGLNSDSTEIEVLTEFTSPPDAAVRENTVPQGSLPDEEISWGQMRLGRGKAFDLAEPEKTIRHVAARREYANVQGRQILIEGVPFQKIKLQLGSLPLQSSISTKQPLIASKTRLLPKPPLAQSSSQAKPMKFASALPARAGFVLDYLELNSDQTNFVFQGDTTYYVSGICNFAGTTTFEGGTIIKLDINGQINLGPSGAINCLTDHYRPAIFTSVDDNSIGDKPDISNGTPVFDDLNVFLNIEIPNVVLHDMRFSYALDAIYQTPTPATIDLWNCQFVDADAVVYGYNIGLHNVLIARWDTDYPAVTVEGDWLDAEQVTADGGVAFLQPYNTSAILAITNSLITAQPLMATGHSAVLRTNNTVYLPSPTGPIYQTVGAASYYLTNGSPYRGCGTTAINPALLAGLAALTTWPPVVFDGAAFNVATNFGPQAPRDYVGNPDLGYHYPSLDYVFGGSDFNARVIFSAGTAVGWFEDNGSSDYSGQPYGITLNNGGYLELDGTATAPCEVPLFSEVQEGGKGNWSNYGYEGGFMMNPSTPTLQIFAKFTQWTGTPGWGFIGDYGTHGIAAMANSEVYNENWGGTTSSYYFTNCLFWRMQSPLWSFTDNESLTMQNCTLFNGGLALSRSSGKSLAYWTILNCAFDGTAFLTSDDYAGNPAYTRFDYNAYNSANTNNWQNFGAFGSPCVGTLETVGPHDLTTTGYGWETSWFGNCYLPAHSPLIQAGSVTADQVGLYHFTTQTNQVPETNSVVTIGYHYVATDAFGDPLDTNGDGIPDYLEDANGNGLVDSGEIGWNIIGDLGLQVIISSPRNGSTLP